MKQKEIFDIPFPDTAELEKTLLADAVGFPEAFGDIYPLVHPDFFTTPARLGIWNNLVELYNAGRSIDIPSVGAICGKPFIDEVLPKFGQTGSAYSAMQHAALLRDGAAKRRAYYAAIAFVQNAVSAKSTEQDIMSSVEQFCRDVEGPAPLQSEASLSAIINGIGDDIQKMAASKARGECIKIPTGFRQLDWWTYQGFSGGQLIVIAARPSVGKTAVMLHMAKTAARYGNPAYICSLEMTGSELGQRLLVSTGKIAQKDIASANVEWQDFEDANGELSSLPIVINDFSRSLDEIVCRVTQAVKQGHCKICFIDYLGLFQDAISIGGNLKLYQVIARITGTLKALAKRLGIPIVILSQMNRDQAREKRTPELYDLRDSGSIEQDADIVLMLEPKPEERRLLMWLRKNRNGVKDEALILIPNETYTNFEEGNVLFRTNGPGTA